MKVDSHCGSATASLPSFILPLLVPKSAKLREIPRKFKLMIIVLGVNQKRICDFPLVINSNFGRIPYRFRDIDFKASKWLVFPTPPLFDTPACGESLSISG